MSESTPRVFVFSTYAANNPDSPIETRVFMDERSFRATLILATNAIARGQERAWAEWGRRIGESYWVWGEVPGSYERYRDHEDAWALYANDMELEQLERDLARL